jgi:hypothetical protein
LTQLNPGEHRSKQATLAQRFVSDAVLGASSSALNDVHRRSVADLTGGLAVVGIVARVAGFAFGCALARAVDALVRGGARPAAVVVVAVFPSAPDDGEKNG